MDVVLPKNSLTMTEAEIVSWLVGEGQQVVAGEPLFTMETAKSQVDVESPATGVLARIVRPTGEVVAAGEVVAVLDTGDGAPAGTERSGTGAVAPSRVVSGAAAALAADLDIDIDQVRGSGTGGRVLEEDVIRAASATLPTGSAPAAPGPSHVDRGAVEPADPDRSGAPSGGGALPEAEPSLPGRSVPDRGPAGPGTPVAPSTPDGSAAGGGPGEAPATEPAPASAARRAGMRLTETVATVPVFHLAGRLDFAPVWDRMRAAGVSVTDVLVVASARALREVPVAHARAAGGGDVERYTRARIGVLVRAGDALVPLALDEPDRLGVVELHRRRRALTDRVGTGPLPLHALRQPTFVISNIGRPGVEWFSAVLYPRTAVTLAVGSLAPDRSVRVVLTCDHRVVDGVDAADFLAALSGAVTEMDLEGAR
jgi:pyruvate dehydrogenase E2 component (dihydrolipoamide acetyltransferase)